MSVRIGEEVQEVLRKERVIGMWVLVLPGIVFGAVGSDVETVDEWVDVVLKQLTDPLFWFGMTAQFLFFMRFIWQWLVSEKKKRSTIPIVFWYFSLAGGMAMFVYGCLRVDLVIMLGQLLAIVIYSRNLMLIYGRQKRLRQAGLPVTPAGSEGD